MWIARDKDGNLYIYNRKPKKFYKLWGFDDSNFKSYEIEHDFDNLFADIKWEDEEPTEVILKK